MFKNYDYYDTQKTFHIIFYIPKEKQHLFRYKIQDLIFTSTHLNLELPKKILTHERKDYETKIEIILTKENPERWPYNQTENNSKFDIEYEESEEEMNLEKLLYKIYENGNDDLKRAMNKSIFESEGTVLSTSWKDVGSKKVSKIEKYEESDNKDNDHNCN